MRMHKFVMILLALFVFLGTAVESNAHNRAGMVKVPLQTDVLTEDGVAFYFEAYVAERADDKGTKGRYFIWSFDSFEMHGNEAHVHVTVTDQKTNKKNNEEFHLTRNSDDTWNHVNFDGKMIEEKIYTMVEPPTFTTIHMIGAIAILLVALAIVIVVRNAKKKNEQQQA